MSQEFEDLKNLQIDCVTLYPLFEWDSNGRPTPRQRPVGNIGTMYSDGNIELDNWLYHPGDKIAIDRPEACYWAWREERSAYLRIRLGQSVRIYRCHKWLSTWQEAIPSKRPHPLKFLQAPFVWVAAIAFGALVAYLALSLLHSAA